MKTNVQREFFYTDIKPAKQQFCVISRTEGELRRKFRGELKESNEEEGNEYPNLLMMGKNNLRFRVRADFGLIIGTESTKSTLSLSISPIISTRRRTSTNTKTSSSAIRLSRKSENKRKNSKKILALNSWKFPNPIWTHSHLRSKSVKIWNRIFLASRFWENEQIRLCR